MSESRRLGRGLEALLGPISREQAERSGDLTEVPVASIRPNPYQPRTEINEEALQELTASLQVSGLLQPIVVRSNHGSFQLIAGERRWRAAQRLGWSRIPAVIKDVDDRTLLTLALIENLQRDQLSAVEAATSYQRLIEEFKMTQAEVARLVGKDRSTVANALRLLGLPEEVRTLLHQGVISEGHARALLGLPDVRGMSRLARDVVARGWSVRELEARVRGQRPGRRIRLTRRERPAGTPEQQKVEAILRGRLGTDVRVTARRRGRGMLSISYYSNEDLSRILELILGEPFDG